MARRWPRIVVHADMDAFYASIEQLDNPSLRGKALLVGSPSGRGVVLTASYEARPFRVGSAMPMALARRRCPHAIIVPPRFDRYTQVSRQIMTAFGRFSPTVEPLSLDEAFIDMTGAEGIFGAPAEMGRRIREAVQEITGGLTASVGVSGTKYVAKVASDHRKPDGLTIVAQTHARAFLAPLPISRLWGAGPKVAARLESLGFRTIGQIAAADPQALSRRLGSLGPHFHRLAQAVDDRAIVSHRGAESIGSERTLSDDISDPDEIKRHLRRSADAIGRRLRAKRLQARGVRVKLKTRSFRSMTRQTRLSRPTDVAQVIYEAGVNLLTEFDLGESFRLVGMAGFDLVRPDDPIQLDLFEAPVRQRRLEATMDAVRQRFGPDAVRRAEDLEHPPGVNLSDNLDLLND